ncbi:MAG: HD domain-containing protein [Candidatus Eremiobacteraeota bacterium]|nr:HD domain-containing protein [Candidatus Eremiobacteraeota bacterium]
MKHPLDQRLAAALPANSLYAVGGRVRDEVRHQFSQSHLETKDHDYLVTGVGLEELTTRLTPLGRVSRVGASFAVIKLSTEFGVVDVALPRRERSSGVGHREYEIISAPDIPIDDDLARRDFRMNMMARAVPTGELLDPFGGARDIAARRIDILNPQALLEDPLRMLRACQFAARFEYELSESTLGAMQDAAPLVATVSGERIGEELTKMLRWTRVPSLGLELMRATGLQQHVWPELLEGVGVEQNEWHLFDVYRHNLETLDATRPGDLIVRLAALFHDVGKPRVKDGPHFYRHERVGEVLTRSMLGRLHFGNEVIEGVAHLVRQHMYDADPGASDAAIRRFIRRIGPTSLERQFELREADVVASGLPRRDDSHEIFMQRVREELDRKPPFSVRDLEIDGAMVLEIMKRKKIVPTNFKGDARVGAALRYALEQVTESPRDNVASRLSYLIERFFEGAVP